MIDCKSAPLQDERYGDVYRSDSGATQESWSVFIEPAWRRILALAAQGQRRFHMLELGFGLGVNLSTLLAHWSKYADSDWFCYFHSIEKHPLHLDALRAAWCRIVQAGQSHPELCWLEQLESDGAYALSGMHRYQLGEQFLFDLHVADVTRALKRLNSHFDIVFMDGFSERLNPAMWSGEAIRLLRRHLVSDALLLTYASSKSLRDRLSALEFQVSRKPGFARKKFRIEALYRPYRKPRARSMPCAPRRLLIVGAGLGGQCMAQAAVARGLQCLLIDPKAQQDQDSDAQLPAFMEHLHCSPDDNELARLSRAALLMSQRFPAGNLSSASQTSVRGRVQMLKSPEEQEVWMQRLRALRALNKTSFDPWSALFCFADQQHLILPRSGARILPRKLPAQQIRACVASLVREAGVWSAYDASGSLLASADAMVVTSPQALTELGFQSHMRLQLKAGVSLIIDIESLNASHPAWQLSSVLAHHYQLLRLEAPPRVLVGALYGEPADADAMRDLLDAIRNLLELDAQAFDQLKHAPMKLWRGMRYSAPDHLPLIGALADEVAVNQDWDRLKSNTRLPIPRLEQAYALTALGARGALWAPFGAAILLDLMQSIPYPLESDLFFAIDPARALIRDMRRGIRHNRVY